MPAKPEAVVLDVWTHIEPRFGGIGPAASALANAVTQYGGMHGHQIAVCDKFEQECADGISPLVEKIINPRPRGWADFRLSGLLRDGVAGADICHVHGLWSAHSLAVRRLAAQLGKPFVSSVHGHLEHWEMRNKWLKKSLYSWLLERPSLSQSSCLRALSEHEVGDYRRFGVRQPIVLVPNGINALDRVGTAEFLSEFPELTGKSIVLFLSRLHRRKGILNLLRAWKQVALRHDDAHLVIAGPDHVEIASKVKQLISELNMNKTVTKIGVVSGTKKLAALSAATYFCLPSYSEGFSVAILEALSIGLPVIITPECNVPSVASLGAGVLTSNDPAALARTLIDCLGASGQDRRKMSLAAHNLARSQFDWRVTGKAMHSVYEWLLGGNTPDCMIA